MAHVSSWRREALGFGVWLGRVDGRDLSPQWPPIRCVPGHDDQVSPLQ